MYSIWINKLYSIAFIIRIRDRGRIDPSRYGHFCHCERRFIGAWQSRHWDCHATNVRNDIL